MPSELNFDEKVVLLRSTKQDAVVLNRWWRKSAVDHVLDVVMTDMMPEEEWQLTLAEPVATNAECVQLFQERVGSLEFAVSPPAKRSSGTLRISSSTNPTKDGSNSPQAIVMSRAMVTPLEATWKS